MPSAKRRPFRLDLNMPTELRATNRIDADWGVLRSPLQGRHNEHGASPFTNASIAQPFVQAQIKENVKALRHWPLWAESPGDRASNEENVSIW